ncbi:M23 family metallopeptidase [Anoxynatronum sibiricum]|uniref:M23 family metallopeptidase n=1 Tax=Anoxynatronum sibiricum TaxID=210623 RepID=A0ABU9VRD2_9CLOT
MLKKPPHLAHRKKSRMTLMLVPNDAKKIRQFTCPTWLPGILSGVLVLTLTLLSVSTARFSNQLENTQQALIAEKITVAELTEENRRHQQEIVTLTDQFHEIDGRLSMLSELENKVLHMVGLETDSSGEETLTETGEDPTGSEEDYFSRQFLLVTRSSDSRSQGPVYDTYEVDVAHLSELIESQTTSMTQLVDDVEKQLDYLDAQPNQWPASGRISSRFGYRVSPTNRRRTEFHQGLDIANSSGTSIAAAGSGIVTYSGYNGGYGRMIIISHGYGYTSVYAHNSQNLVEVGDRVEKGDLIGRMGRTGRATGSHLHFEVRVHGDPVDPLTILQ